MIFQKLSKTKFFNNKVLIINVRSVDGGLSNSNNRVLRYCWKYVHKLLRMIIYEKCWFLVGRCQFCSLLKVLLEKLLTWIQNKIHCVLKESVWHSTLAEEPFTSTSYFFFLTTCFSSFNSSYTSVNSIYSKRNLRLGTNIKKGLPG